MRVWITRTQPSAQQSAKAFEAQGFEAVVAPLLTIGHIKPPLPNFDDNDVFIFTSKNAVSSAAGNSDDVLELILAKGKKSKNYHHISGEVVRGDIHERLREAGYNASRHVLYKTAPSKLPRGFDIVDIDVIVFHSPLAAKCFTQRFPNESNIATLSISEATALVLNTQTNLIAKAPTETSMLSALIAYRDNRG